MTSKRQMRLWALHPHSEVLARTTNPWTPAFEKVLHLVARARDEQETRELAQDVAGNEGKGIYRRLGFEEDEIAADVWLDPRYTACSELLAEGEPGVVIIDRIVG
jgi:hypothetical protein